MKSTRCRHDSATPQEAGRDSFTPDLADMLCAECLMRNRGIVQGAWFRLCMYNLLEVYRVVVTTDVEETDLEFSKVTGGMQFWRNGIGGAAWN